MIQCGPNTRVFLSTAPTDMRRGFDGLAELVRHPLQEDPLSGHLFLFTNRRRDRLKILAWDGSGLWVCAKRLEKGTFSWPEPVPGESKVRVGASELALLLGGLDWASTRRRDWWRRLPGEGITESAGVTALVSSA